MTKRYLFALLGLFVLGCGCSVAYLVFNGTISRIANESSSCESAKITDSDVEFINNYGNDLFPENDWTRSYTVKTSSAFVERTSEATSGAVSINNFILCDASLEKLKESLNDKTIATMLREYDQYESLISCQESDVLLYEFEAMRKSKKYNIKIWVKPLEKRHHAVAVALVFGKDEAEYMNEYSSKLFPELIACNKES